MVQRPRLATLYGRRDSASPPSDDLAHRTVAPRTFGLPAFAGVWTVRHALTVLFLLAVLPTCLTLALLTPIGQVADEPAHVMRTASLLHGQWIGRRAPTVMGDGSTRVMAGLDVDQAVLGVQGGPDRPKLLRDYALWSRAQGWAGFLYFYQIPNVAIYTPTFYVPAAIGMGAARWAGAGPFVATYAARMANVACFAAMGLAALLLARRGHALLFCTLALPMTVGMAASVNQDGLIITASALAAGLLTRSAPITAAGPALPRSWSYQTAALLLACITAAKPPYAPLLVGLLFPLPPVRAWLRLRRPLLLRAAVIVAMLLPGLLWGWFALTAVATPYDRPPYEAGPLWPGPRPAVFDGTSAAAQIKVLLAEPLRFLTLPWNTIIHDAALLRSAVGVLGWLSIILPDALYTLWYYAVGAALLCDLLARRGEPTQARLAELALSAAAAIACVLGIYLSQYLAWTPVGHPAVLGPSGRYLLPILPLLALGLPAVTLRAGGPLRAALLTLPAAAVIAGAIVLPPAVVYATILR